jgi:ABC-type Fe3+/spermidine/putrescine transport system ATPase subunit
MGEQTITAVDGASFSIDQGEFCVIVGPSGAGKTTVLNMLGGMDSCDRGLIRLGDLEVSSSQRAPAHRVSPPRRSASSSSSTTWCRT